MRRVAGFVQRHFEETIAGAALLVLVFSVSWGVVTRYVTQTPATWTGDAASLSFAWLIFPGAAASLKHGMHMSIDIFWRLIPDPPSRILGLLVDGFLLVFLAYATWLGIQFCIASWDDPMPILRWPRSFLYAAVPVGFGLMLLRMAGAARRRFAGVPDTGPALPDTPRNGGRA